jgi:uncharacterized membrane protein YfcA
MVKFFVLGGWLGAKIGTGLSNVVLSRIFSVLLLVSAMRVIFTNQAIPLYNSAPQ